jgi:hypothetical protein
MRIRRATIPVVALLSGSLSLASCAGKVVVKRVEAPGNGAKASLDGVVYALPRTVVKVSITIEKTTASPGQFGQYRDLFFPEDKSAMQENGEEDKASPNKTAGKKPTPKFGLSKPTISTFGEPDPDKFYFVKITGHGPVDRTAAIDYTELGTVSGIQGGAENYTTDIIVSSFQAALGIAARTAFAGTEAATSPLSTGTCAIKSDGDVAVLKGLTAVHDPELFVNYCDMEIARRSQIQKDLSAAAGQDNVAPQINAPLAKALRAYGDIKTLEARRRVVVSGVAGGPVGTSPDTVVKQLDAEIAKETGTFFTGQTKKETWTPSLEVRPSSVSASASQLLLLDPAKGVCLLGFLPPQEKAPAGFLVKESDCAPSKGVLLKVTFQLDPSQSKQMFQKVQESYTEKGDRSFRYLIPAATLAELTTETATESDSKPKVELVNQARIMIGQFGAEVSLPASSGGRSLNYALKFYEATGALKSFSLASKSAIQAATINSVGTSTNALLDARNKQQQAEAQKTDELNKLERQRKILEDEAKIKELCAQLQVSCEP